MFWIIVACVFGWITSNMAASRGRSTRAGFWWGFFFSLWAIIGYLIAGDTEAKKVERIKKAMKD